MSKRKTATFLGRIVSSVDDFQGTVSDVIGPHQVWFPRSRADVATAVTLSENQKTFIRSGIQVARQDVVDGAGGIVINLRELVNIAINKDEVRAEAAATTEAVAERLANQGLVLPLSGNPLKSIASNVINEGSSYLMRSLGPLSNYVSKIRAVKPNGKPVTLKGSVDVSCVDQCHTAHAVITEVEFKAAPVKGLWMYRETCLYPGQERFLEISRALFMGTSLPEKCDLVLDAYNGPYDIPLMRISALGSTKKGTNKLKKLVNKAFANIQKDFDSGIVEEEFFNSDVLDAIADAGMGASIDPTINSERLFNSVMADDLDDFLIRHVEDVQRGIAFGNKGEGKLNRDFHLSSRLQVNRNNDIEASGFAYTSNLTNEFSPTTHMSAATADIRLSVPLHARVPLPITLTESAGPIPNFQGVVYRRKDLGFKLRANQYATSSYPADKMTPFMVAYPRNMDDILAAIAFAQDKKKHIVARSGGHQYSGKSSGGKETIVLSMDAFNHRRISGNIVEVGPAVRLTVLADLFNRENMTIPHGECPLVAIGGHAQTGGYGHLVRSFGLALDYVQAFDIVLADGSRRTVIRPQSDASPTTADEKLDQEIFWGVLGGNAGSFGIVTNYRFECIKNSDHPNSYGFSAIRKYRKNRFLKLMKEVQKWTKGIENGTLPSGIDFMMSVESAGRSPIPLMVVELVHSNLGGKNEVVDGDREFRSIIKAASSGASFWEQFLIESGPKALSELSDSFVRRWPALTPDGREFKYPYTKRINCTMNALTDTFITEFVGMINKVVKETFGVKLVFQMVFGGGAYQNTPRQEVTSIPHRDYVYCFIFDLFYKSGFEDNAKQLQREMQNLIDAHFSTDQELRVFWGTFDDTDISKKSIRKMYYDSEKKYKKLQALKKRVDPNDLFHTELTVQLPSSS